MASREHAKGVHRRLKFPLPTAAVPAGQLGALFERILAEFPQYSPVALSRDPYVIRLDDFVTDEEAAAIQEVCRPHFERSLAGDQLNPVRTSFQCWCNFAGCFTDPLVHRVTRRINRLTNTPYDNGEDLQVVRYEPGQFYRRHHDQNTAVWAPQVRARAPAPRAASRAAPPRRAAPRPRLPATPPGHASRPRVGSA